MTLHSLDPLASPTLAALYLRQGHLQRAGSVVDSLLKKNPEDGVALALAHRIQCLTTVGLEVWIHDDALALRLTAPYKGDLTLHVQFFPSTALDIFHTRQPWTANRGGVRLPLPSPRGAAVAKLTGQLQENDCTVAISRVVSW